MWYSGADDASTPPTAVVMPQAVVQMAACIPSGHKWRGVVEVALANPIEEERDGKRVEHTDFGKDPPNHGP
jgi:hypothetical protein